MTLPVWPATLPTIPLQGSGPTALAPDTLDTDFEDGPPRSRPRSVTNRAEVSHRFRLTNAEFLVFQAFLRDTLNQGAARFTMPMWKPGATLPLPVRTVKMAGRPGLQTLGPVNYVTLQLLVWDY